MNRMNQLSCCADNCENFKDGYCSLSSIQVAGEGAQNSASTCCVSFVEQSGRFSSESRLECPYSNVRCNAENCVHNSGGSCEADYVDIAGHSAASSDDTVCSSFRTENM